MSKSVKILGGAALLLATAAIGGSLISVALAGDNNTSGDTGDELTDTGAYCQTFLDSFASHLGVSTDALAPAAKAAAIDAVIAAVDAGDLTQDQADAMTTRINNWDGTGCGFMGFHLGGKGGHGAGIGMMQDMATAIADKLGMEPAALREAMHGSSLKQVATDQNVNYGDVVSAALDAAKTDLDAAVSDGTLTQSQADAIYSRLETWLNNGGEMMGRGMGGFMGGGHHHGGPGFPFFGGDDQN